MFKSDFSIIYKTSYAFGFGYAINAFFNNFKEVKIQEINKEVKMEQFNHEKFILLEQHKHENEMI